VSTRTAGKLTLAGGRSMVPDAQTLQPMWPGLSRCLGAGGSAGSGAVRAALAGQEPGCFIARAPEVQELAQVTRGAQFQRPRPLAAR
jgi:hypothetical protein